MSDITSTQPSSRLEILDFQRDIKRLTKDFAGRKWLFEAVDDWLVNTDQRFFILTGKPGAGKSAIAARLTQIRPQNIAAYHFCIAGRVGTITPNTILRSLAAQLGESLPGYGEALANTIKPHQLIVNVKQKIGKVEEGGKVVGVIINNLTAGDPEEELDILFRAPLSTLSRPKSPLFLLIDSLDEAMTFQGKTNLIHLLAITNDFPDWVHFVCTTRPEGAVLSYLKRFKPFVLAVESQRNLDDLERYINHRVSQDKMQTQLRAAKIAAEELMNQIARAAAGNFLYTKVLLDDLETNRHDLQHLATLPQSLDDIYHRFLRRFADEDWDEKFQPLLGKLTVAQEPITEKQLANFSGLPQRQVRRSLAVVDQYLDIIEGGEGSKSYRLFHQSLRDYLLNEDRSEMFWCDAVEEHALITDYYLKHQRTGWAEGDLYGLRHLPVHLAGAGRQVDLKLLLLDFNFLQAKLTGSSINDLINDFDNLAAQERQDPARLVQNALQLAAHVLSVDDTQLAGQLVGRLKGIDQPELTALTKRAETWRGAIWLCPLQANLTPPGGPLRRVLKGRAGGHAGTVRSLAITPDGQWAITAGNSNNDLTVRLWNLETGRFRHILNSQAEAGGVTPLAFTPAATHAVTAFASEVRLWDLDDGMMTAAQDFEGAAVSSLAISQQADLVFIGALDGSLRLWRPEVPSVVELAGHEEPVTAVALSANGRHACSLSNSTLSCWDLRSEKLVDSIQITNQADITYWNPPPLLFTDEGNSILFGSPLQNWAFDKGTLAPLLPDAGGEQILGVSSDGKQALSTGDGRIVAVWDVISGKHLFDLPRPDTTLSVAALSDSGRRAITADNEHDLRIWDVTGGLQAIPGGVTGEDFEFVDFTEDSRMAIFRLPDKSLIVRIFEDDALTPALDRQEALITAWESRQQRLEGLYKKTYDSLWPPKKKFWRRTVKNGSSIQKLLRVSENGLRAISSESSKGKYSDSEEPLVP